MQTHYVAFFVVAAVAIFLSLLVFITLIVRGNKNSCVTFLLFWFHLSLIGQEFTILPYISGGNRGGCEAMEFLHYYFGMMNINVLLCLVHAHRCTLLPDSFHARKIIFKFGTAVFLLIPLATTVPFLVNLVSSDYHGDTDDTNMDNNGGRIWCTLSPLEGQHSRFLACYYAVAWVLLIVALGNMLYTTIVVARMYKELARYYFSTVGLFVIIAILSWLPRTINRTMQLREGHHDSGQHTHFIAFYPIEMSGILFGLIFFALEQSSMAIFKGAEGQEILTGEDSIVSLFSWEKDDLVDFLDNLPVERRSGSVSSFGSSSVNSHRRSLSSYHSGANPSSHSFEQSGHNTEMVTTTNIADVERGASSTVASYPPSDTHIVVSPLQGSTSPTGYP